MVLVDTNILLHAINSDSPEHARARAALEALANGDETWVLTWGIIYEFYRFATHPRVFPKPLAMETAHEFIGSLLDSPACLLATETELHRDVLQKSLSELPRVGGNLVHDLHAAVLMREHAVKDILTLDTDFKTFPWLRIRGL